MELSMRKYKKKKFQLTAYDIALMGMMVAVIEACKFVMASFLNIELTSFWLIIFTLMIGWKIVFVVPVFILIEGLIYGFGMWWVRKPGSCPYPSATAASACRYAYRCRHTVQ